MTHPTPRKEKEISMYIAMNRFKVAKGKEADFETVWRSRKRYLHELDGFMEFTLLRGPEREDHTLYSSHTVWADKSQFIAWTNSEQFRLAHANAGKGTSLNLLGHPEFEGFEAVLIEDNRALPSVAE
jgi:heme-degrading monooxygenase HmoA